MTDADVHSGLGFVFVLDPRLAARRGESEFSARQVLCLRYCIAGISGRSGLMCAAVPQSCSCRRQAAGETLRMTTAALQKLCLRSLSTRVRAQRGIASCNCAAQVNLCVILNMSTCLKHASQPFQRATWVSSCCRRWGGPKGRALDAMRTVRVSVVPWMPADRILHRFHQQSSGCAVASAGHWRCCVHTSHEAH